MDEKYFPEQIEEKWQAHWRATDAFASAPKSDQPKFYCLEMLPYPSGFLHMGHVRNYSIGDALAWYKRLQGFNVLHPIGWDSFGQPAEQAAIKRGINPRVWTEDNIAHMRGQLQRLGISYDWSREIFAHRPEYYRWDQWFFLKMFERGLAYKKMTPVNWCPTCETTLSNEQASGGICWRCGNPVEKRDIVQWFLRITDYAEQLLNDMQEIEAGWPERVLTMQRNWIGRSEGAFLDFAMMDFPGEKIRVFTTRIDTIYGATAVVVAAEHPLIAAHVDKIPNRDAVEPFIVLVKAEKAQAKAPGAEEEKLGVDTGLRAINPFSGEEVPVWIGNYVLMEYGTGAVMSVPGHDERDFEFATKYGMPIRRVIASLAAGNEVTPRGPMAAAMTEYGVMINSQEWSGTRSDEAKRKMSVFAQEHGFGEAAVTYRLRDWGISRQRFWGAPIPIIYCDSCGTVPVPEADLPVRLPDDVKITGVGESPLASVPEFFNVTCPTCGGVARRETDTMDTFVDSSWYFFRYCDPHNTDAPVGKEIAAYWTPVDQYIGGIDHAVMHLLYTRFWTKVMRDIGLVPFNEPVKRLMTQGMVTNLIEGTNDWKRMSKSAGNGVDPDDMIGAFGADSVRLFVLFAAPVENELRWQEAGIDGAKRFLQRVYRHVWRWRASIANAPGEESAAGDFSAEARSLRRKTHQTIARLTADMDKFQLNTSIAALMELSNELGDFKVEPGAAAASDLYAVREALQALVIMLTPFAPHIAEEMWAGLTGSNAGLLGSQAKWPAFNAELAVKEELEIPVQVNGKLRSRIIAAPDATKEAMEAAALADEKVRTYTDGKQIVKVVVVPQRLVNIVVKG
ncbi:MAG: leucine--tRNA ligase [Pyrinomonadaceae bacterium]